MTISFFSILAVCVLMASSCGENARETADNIRDNSELLPVPALDRSKREVPLEHIYFDTFQPTGPRALPLTEATEEQILHLRDVIPPLHNPKYQRVDEVTWLQDHDLVIGYTAENEAWAFPVKILNFHEIVNDHFADQAVLVTYCPLCRSGIVYDRKVGEQTLKFGNTSALYESGMVMLDYQTGSYWWQVSGKAIAGTLSGSEMNVLPSITTQWKEWKRMYPKSRVLSWYTGHIRQYDRDSFANITHALNQKNFIFPVSRQAMDERLPSGSVVLVTYLGDSVKAYPIHELGNTVIHDRVADQDLVVFINADTQTAIAFDPKLEEEMLSFKWQGKGIIDTKTNSVWDFSGKAVAGKLSGKQLKQFPSKYMFWYAAAASEPDIVLYSSPETPPE